MPITRWVCAGCGGREVPLDHFETSACGETVCHPDYAAALLADRSGQYVTGAVRVTHGLSCPRRTAIEEEEGFAVNPLEANAPLTGVSWHSLMEAAAPKSEAEVEVSGVIGGVTLKGKIDRIRRIGDEVILEDWKHISDFQVKYRRQDGVKVEHQAQLSIYAEMVHQSMQVRPTRGIIWYHSSMGGANALTPVKFELMKIEEALEVRPYSGEFSVFDLLKQADGYFNPVQLEDAIKHDIQIPDPTTNPYWKILPLAGQSMKFGNKSACDYCAVRSICMEAENGAPF